MISMRRIIEQVDGRYGFSIYKEEERIYDDFTGEYRDLVYVYFNVINSSDDILLGSFLTLEEAQRYIDRITNQNK